MDKKNKGLLYLVVFLLICTLLVGCSGKNAECKVTIDRDGYLGILVNPPGEDGASKEKGDLVKKTSTSPSGSSTTIEGDLEKIYAESGNSYNINVFVSISDDRIKEYELEVTGGVYGDTPHTCSK